jgi:hypothetical protein
MRDKNPMWAAERSGLRHANEKLTIAAASNPVRILGEKMNVLDFVLPTGTTNDGD